MNLLGYIRFRSTFSLWSLILSRIIQRERERERERERRHDSEGYWSIGQPSCFFMLCVFQNKEDFKMGKKSQIWLFLMPVLLDCPV